MKLRRKLLSVLGNGPLAAPTPLAAEAADDDEGSVTGRVFLFKKLNRPKRDGGLAAVVGMVLWMAG